MTWKQRYVDTLCQCCQPTKLKLTDTKPHIYCHSQVFTGISKSFKCKFICIEATNNYNIQLGMWFQVDLKAKHFFSFLYSKAGYYNPSVFGTYVHRVSETDLFCPHRNRETAFAPMERYRFCSQTERPHLPPQKLREKPQRERDHFCPHKERETDHFCPHRESDRPPLPPQRESETHTAFAPHRDRQLLLPTSQQKSLRLQCPANRLLPPPPPFLAQGGQDMGTYKNDWLQQCAIDDLHERDSLQAGWAPSLPPFLAQGQEGKNEYKWNWIWLSGSADYKELTSSCDSLSPPQPGPASVWGWG